ncbi:hypothetical protein ColTof4_01161 [Colletotrichum tofieldiae]|nr:hypothetical protein ColTof3_08387 [Colletotrichum tofieldiae]GKT68738.1 hypothetical protein ColTof4_01161 [Colletotrichum tofieldiae]
MAWIKSAGDPSHVLLEHPGGQDATTDAGEVKWLVWWETSGRFLTWLRSNLGKWRERFDEEAAVAVDDAKAGTSEAKVDEAEA